MAPNARDRFAVALAKEGLGRRDIGPSVNLFKPVFVEPDGSFTWRGAIRTTRSGGGAARRDGRARGADGDAPRARSPSASTRSVRSRSPPSRGVPADADDPIRTATPEAQRAFENTDDWLLTRLGHADERVAVNGSVRVVLDETVVRARAPWSHVVLRGQTLRIVDLEGNQAVDFLLYAADDPAERYSAADTIAAQGNIFLTTGSVLRSNEGTADDDASPPTPSAPRHDRRGLLARVEHAALRPPHQAPARLRRELPATSTSAAAWASATWCRNINLFMNVPVDADGSLGIVDGISAPGLYVELRAEMDVIVVISNCPQINNPCNGFNPTPVRMIVIEPPGHGVTSVRASPDRQPRRDRLPHHPHPRRHGHRARSRCTPTPTRLAARARWPTTPCRIGPAPRRRRAI